MKIYHTETQEDYDALMVELDRGELEWFSGKKATELNAWEEYRGKTYIFVDDGKIECSDEEYFRKECSDIPIQKYKANTVELAIKQSSNNNDELFHKIITNLERTYLAKNKDYGNSFEESLDEFGEIAGIVRIGDKFNRIKSLSKTEEINVKDESKIDTLMDMANYCIMQAKWLMKGGR